MESTFFYFDLDYYGVGFYEEEIMTESQRRAAAAASRRYFGRGVRVLHELGDNDYRNPEYYHCYKHERKETRASSSEIGEGKLEEPGKAAGAVSQHPNKRHTKHYKFTYRQLRELDRVFQETQYPDALQRKALAELIHVEERKVKAWFKNKRAKYRKIQTELLLSRDASGTVNNFPLKMDEHPKSASAPEEPIGFILCQQHLGQSCWP
ncbi:retina and anterior neural fold homeobox protein 2 [Phodopus roborovskii]|uniref:Rhox10 protein n=1 Tax=Phodopus roborovskii TaxID=109678 RepID=A0AAU9YZU7_PHORO|nr:retina and anterior neural fold homeobox protein 2 [Phodopus roborovskii]CAH6779920.1 Rhox10 [Phodopus roborovskii]